MSILDRLQLLVRSQTTPLASGRYGTAPAAPVSSSTMDESGPSVGALDQLEDEALRAAGAGQQRRANALARQAAAMEFQLTQGAFGSPAIMDVDAPAGPTFRMVELPPNPYGVANPPVRAARIDRDAPTAAPGWYEQPDAFARFDAWVAGMEPAPATRTGSPASSGDPLRALESRLRGDV